MNNKGPPLRTAQFFRISIVIDTRQPPVLNQQNEVTIPT